MVGHGFGDYPLGSFALLHNGTQTAESIVRAPCPRCAQSLYKTMPNLHSGA